MYTQSLNVDQALKTMVPLLKGPAVQCALCGREFARISPGHLTVHRDYLNGRKGIKSFKKRVRLSPDPSDGEPEGVEQSEDRWVEEWHHRDETLIETYERLFGGKDQLNAIIQKIFKLYQPSKTKWLLMDKPPASKYATWYEVRSDNPSFVPNRLCLSMLKDHLLLKCTVGVFPRSQYKTHFVTWDVDLAELRPEDTSWSTLTEAHKAVRSITAILREWGLHPHVVVSGRKGYHVTVYFNYAISIRLAMSLYKAVLRHPSVPNGGTGLKIECLPIERGNKLPLGVHWGTGVYCGFVDPYTLEALDNPYDYLLEIVPDCPNVLHEVTDAALNVTRLRSTVIEDRAWSKDATESAYKIGIVAPGTRHDTLVKVAAYVRNTPLCPESLPELVNVLINWSRQQYDDNPVNIKTGWEEHLRDLERVARYVWWHPLTGGIPKSIRVTAAIVHWIRVQTPVLAEQQLLFVAWFERMLVGEQFYLGYEQAREMSGLAKNSLDSAFKALRDKGILIVNKDYYHAINGIVPSRTRQYRFATPPAAQTVNAILLTIDPEDWNSNLWFRLLRTLFMPDELKRWYPFAYHRILSVRPLFLGHSSA